MFKLVTALLLCAGVSMAQFQCPKDDGFFPDPQRCDKFYECRRGELTEELCPDGLVFDATLSPKVKQCNYPFIVECPENSSLQPPQPSGVECPRQNGYFEHEDASNCEQYYECTNGEFQLRTCATGLVFDEFTGTCQWAHTNVRTGCNPRTEVLEDGFQCPSQEQLAVNGHALDHARYPKPDDCRFFYVCHGGSSPREVGCPLGTVFNDETLMCDSPENVKGCENYYPADNDSKNALRNAGLAF